MFIFTVWWIMWMLYIQGKSADFHTKKELICVRKKKKCSWSYYSLPLYFCIDWLIGSYTVFKKNEILKTTIFDLPQKIWKIKTQNS